MKIDPLDQRSHSSRSVVATQRANHRVAAPVVDKRNLVRPDGRSTPGPSPGMKTSAAPRYKVPDADLYKLDRNLSERIAKASASQLGRVVATSRPVSRAESTISYRAESTLSYRPESRVGGYRSESRAGGYATPKPPSSVLSMASSSPLPRVRAPASTISPRNATPVRSLPASPPKVPAVARAQTPAVRPKLAASATAPAGAPVKYRVPSALRAQLSRESLEEKKALVLEFTLSWSGVNDVTTLCLLDPNATVALISESFVKENAVPRIKRETPIELLDREKNPIPGAGKAYTLPMILRHQKHYTRESFEIATVDERVNAVLPASWMEKHELVDLFGGAQYFGTASCLQNCTKVNASKDNTAPVSVEPAQAPALRPKKSGTFSTRPGVTPRRTVSGSATPATKRAVKPSTSPAKDTLKPNEKTKKPLPSRPPARPEQRPAARTTASTKTPASTKKTVSPGPQRTPPGKRVVSGTDSRIPQRKSSSGAPASPQRQVTAPAAPRPASPAISTVSSDFDPNPSA